MTASHLRTLGAFVFTIDGREVARPSTQKARALLAYLALRQNATIPREEVVEVFWPEAQPENARQSLKTALWSIRRAVRDAGVDPAHVLHADHSTIRWLAPTAIDAREFEARARDGDTSALALYAGDFLPGDYDSWASAQRESLIQTLESLLGETVRATGDVGAAQWLLRLNPFSEEAFTSLIDAEIAARRTVAAATLLARFRATLRENGLEVSAAFRDRFAHLETAAETSGTRFAGRTHELADFDQHLRSGCAAAFVVSGDAGLGKTALLQRFARQAAHAGRTVVAFGVPRDPSGFGGWDRVYHERTGRRIEDLALQSGSGLPAALARAVTAALPAGCLVFIDDAHHLQGDAAFVTAAVAAAAGDAGVSLIFGTRPEGLHATLGYAETSTTVEMPLRGLNEDEIRSVLPERGGETDALARSLFARTQGHPLFLQRLLERLDGGTLALEMPASVRALIERRLQERGDDAHGVAALLALDPRFGGDELASILQWNEERVLDALDDLLGLGIVRESAEGAFLEFSHEIVREVARDSLSPQRRKRLHRVAAAMLDGDGTIAAMARRAEHLAGAGEAQAAGLMHLRCSQAAYTAFEPRNAAAFARRARVALLALETTPEIERLTLEIDAAEIKALNAASDPDGAERVATAAIAVAARVGDRRRLFELHALRMRARMRTSELDAIEEDARSALEVASELDDAAAYAEAYLGMLQISLCRVNEAEAMRFSRLAFDAAIACGEPDLAVFVASECLHAQVVFWRFSEAVATMQRGEELIKASSGATSANLRYGMAQLMYLLARYDEGLAQVDRALASLESARPAAGKFVPDRQRTIAILTNARGLIHVARGEWEQAWKAAEAFADNPAALIPGIYPHVVELQVRVLLGRNAPGDADRAAGALATVDLRSLVDDTAMYAAASRARIAARLGDPDAPKLIDEAIEIAVETAKIAGLDVDTVFAGLADAARECGADHRARAQALCDHYRRQRREAAGEHWGGID